MATVCACSTYAIERGKIAPKGRSSEALTPAVLTDESGVRMGKTAGMSSDARSSVFSVTCTGTPRFVRRGPGRPVDGPTEALYWRRRTDGEDQRWAARYGQRERRRGLQGGGPLRPEGATSGTVGRRRAGKMGRRRGSEGWW